MEEEIYNKLPCGGGLWNYKYENKEQFIQKPYENNNSEKIIYSSATQKVATKKENRKQTLMNFIIHKINPLATLYTPLMFQQAEQIFKDKMTDFISKNDHFGPKKKRTLLSWITHNNISSIDDMGKIIADFLSWFLETPFKYIPENSSIIETIQEGEIVYITTERKIFIIR
jgi:hypothetical protein